MFGKIEKGGRFGVFYFIVKEIKKVENRVVGSVKKMWIWGMQLKPFSFGFLVGRTTHSNVCG